MSLASVPSLLFAASLPVAGLLAWAVLRGGRPWLAAVALVPSLLAVYAYWIEPRMLTVKRYDVEVCGGGLPGTVRAVVVADTHLGAFANAVSMDRIAARLARLAPDLVLMPGDFTYHPDAEALPELMAPLGALDVPVYAVMGNHDVGMPGPDYTGPLTAALEAAGVTVLNPGEVVFSAQGKYLRVVGLRDLWEAEERGLPLGVPEEASPMATVLLEHNPDTALRGDLGRYELMVAGHTHGGQVYIPGVTCALTFACDTLRYGYADSPAGKLFVTQGTGMTGLPIRFMAPPRIDVLDIAISRCPATGRSAA